MQISSLLRSLPRYWEALRLAGAFSAAYLLLDQVSFIYALQEFNITPWDPQPALAVALVFFRGRVWMPWIFLTLLFSEVLVRDIQLPVIGGFILPATLTCGYAFIAYLLRGPFEISTDLASRKDVRNMAAALALGAGATGTVYVSVLCLVQLLHWQQFEEALFRFWLGDAIGMLVTLPLLLLLIDPNRRRELRDFVRSSAAAVAIVLIIAALGIVFGQAEEQQVKFFYLLFLPIIWIAARYGLSGAIVAVALIQAGIVVTVISSDHETIAVLEFQSLLLALVLTGLFLGVAVDEWRFASQRLARSQQLTAVGEMATALAHELNQPLTALSTYADAIRLLVRSAPQGDSSLAATADSVRRVATRCADIVGRFRAMTPSAAAAMQDVAIAEPLREAVDALAERAAMMGATVELHIDDDVEAISLDRDRIGLAFRNVIANALDAAAQRTDQPPSVAIELKRESRSHIRITVRDTGYGISLDMIERIFDPFYSGKVHGMGLGLAVSRSIVESHGGRLWAEPGNTGIVHFRLPA